MISGNSERYREITKKEKKIPNRMELFDILAKSEEDVRYGRVAPARDTFDDLRKSLIMEEMSDQ